MKRFWKDVTVEADAVFLDGRPLRTPGRAAVALPNARLADAVADEWRAAGETVDPRAMPLTGLANAAIDLVAPDARAFAAGLARYGETELLCYRAEAPEPLVARQIEIWEPLLAWARLRYDVAFTVTAGVIHKAQPVKTLSRLAAAIAAPTPFELAALSPIVTIGSSLVLALMLAEAAIDPDAVFDAAHLDELWQVELWGEDPVAAAMRAARRADFLRAAEFLKLARGSPSSA